MLSTRYGGGVLLEEAPMGSMGDGGPLDQARVQEQRGRNGGTRAKGKSPQPLSLRWSFVAPGATHHSWLTPRPGAR